VIIIGNLLGGGAVARCRAWCPTPPTSARQGQTMGAVASLNSLMAVLAPVIGRPLLGLVSHLPAGRLAHRAAVLLLRAAAGWAAAGRLHFRRATAAPVAAPPAS
jgi:hypothetical protein